MRQEFFLLKSTKYDYHMVINHEKLKELFELQTVYIVKEALSVLMLCAPVFIFTSGSSALSGRSHCGLSI